jgi:predicted ester cyclase
VSQERARKVSVENNKSLVRRYYEKLWNTWDLGVADEMIAPDIAFRGSLGLTTRGLEGFKQYAATVRAAFPDFHNTIEDLIAEGDTVVARLIYSGTHRGPLFGIAPTGKQVTYAGVAIFRITGSKIVDGWVMGDTLGLLRQLGATTLPGSGG